MVKAKSRTSKPKTNSASGRIDVVFIRKSTQGQEESGQIGNVKNELATLGISISKENWFVGTVSRRKVKSNAAFNRLMELVELGKVGTVYIESQDRWGTADRVELFSLLGILRQHNTRLYDLRAKNDLTERDFATELMAVVNSFKSEKELQDISYRSLRTRVSNFKDSGSWPTGTQPFGFGKACYTPSGKLLWVWQPISRTIGQQLFPGAKGKLTPGPDNIKIPRKDRKDIIKLVPSSNKAHVATIKLIFELFTKVGLSRRQISARLNRESRTFYDSPFTHALVGQILRNPAYVGDTHFGKTQTGEHNTFDSNGVMVALKKKATNSARAVSDRIIKENTHPGLIDRKTWALAQDKCEAEGKRTSYSARNPAYYLKQLFVCGHCGKNMTGRTEKSPDTGAKKVVYVCSSYIAGRTSGQETACGYHRISHADAEQLVLDKIQELNLDFDEAASGKLRKSLDKRYDQLENEDESELVKSWELIEGGRALVEYLQKAGSVRKKDIETLEKYAYQFYMYGSVLSPEGFKGMKIAYSEFKKAVKDAEVAEVESATRKLAELRKEHEGYIRNWSKASERMQAVMRQHMDELETQISEWEPKAIPLSKRLEKFKGESLQRRTERDKIVSEWPELNAREKGEAMRRLFDTVTLYWDREFIPAAKESTRERKTNRSGRFRYTLKPSKFKWALAASNLNGSL